MGSVSIRKLCRREHGFTLVELLIVVVILAILAAVAVPQFTSSTDDAKLAALDATLSRMRSAIDLYYQQHGSYPGAADATGATCPSSGTAGTGDASTAAEQALAFGSQMTMYSSAVGQACSTTDGPTGTYRFGPYLKTAGFGASALPKNPMTDSNAVLVVNAGDLNMTSSVTTGGWKYDIVTGKFIADHSTYDDR